MVPEIWSTTDKRLCHFGPFLHFCPLNNPKNQNFVRMKKGPEDIINLNMCTINQ